MDSTTNKLNDIIKLNRILRNNLSMKGGGNNNINNFKLQLEKHKFYTFYLFIICFCVILYFSFPKSNLNIFKGGANGNPFDKLYESYLNVIHTINENISKLKKQGNEFLEKGFEQIRIHGSKNVSQVNYLISQIYLTFMQIIWIQPVFFLPTGIWIIIILLIIYICCNFILDSKLYLPCWGCQEGNSFYKCLPGTGKGSVSCTIYTELLNNIKFVVNQITNIVNLGKELKNLIYKTVSSVIYLVSNISKWVKNAFSTPLNAIIDAFTFLKKIDIPDNWGFNFGEFLICSGWPYHSNKGKDCIYNKNRTKLLLSHGSNPVFKVLFKALKIILEIPPSMPTFNIPSLSGGRKLRIRSIRIPKMKQPKKQKKYTINTKVNTTLKKENISNNTKIEVKKDQNDLKKNIIYAKLLEVLVQIDINPIKWIGNLFNLLVRLVNNVFKQIMNMFKKIMKFLFKLIITCARSLTNALKNILNQLLKPLDEIADIATKIPKQVYRAIKKIFNIGLFPLISYYFYSMFTTLFPFLGNLKSLIIVLTIIIIILAILIVCPMIGAYYAFLSPYLFTRQLIKNTSSYVLTTILSYEDKIETFINSIKNSRLFKDTIDYLNKTDDIYKYVSIILIIILIIFIILNRYSNINKKISLLITRLIYNRYENRFNNINKKFIEYKLKIYEKEKN